MKRNEELEADVKFGPQPMPSDEEIAIAWRSLPLKYHNTQLESDVAKTVRRFMQLYRGMVGPSAKEVLRLAKQVPDQDWEAKDFLAWYDSKFQSRASVEKPLREEIEKLRTAIRHYGLQIMQTSGDWSLHSTGEEEQRQQENENEEYEKRRHH
jgi:hypothetical protein